MNIKLGHYSELSGDWLLHFLAPLGVFELVAWLSKPDAFGFTLCKREV